MKIYGLKDLEYYRLCAGDIVIFHVKDKQGKFVDLKYEVQSDFLTNINDISDASPLDTIRNDAIFTTLGLHPHEFCSKYYGYKVSGGIWPCYKDYDFEAATNVVKALYTLIDTMNVSPLIKSDLCTIKSDLCTNIIWNGKEFGYNDTDGGWIRINVDSSYYSNPGTSNCYTTSADSTPLVLTDRCTSSCRNPYQESSSNTPIDKLKKISSQIKTIKEDNNSKLKRI